MNREILELTYMRDAVSTGAARQLRIDAGLTLAEIGRAVGVTPSCVHYWERGRVPRGKAAVRYARLLLDLKCLKTALEK